MMTKIRIYQCRKSASQSGLRKAQKWVVEWVDTIDFRNRRILLFSTCDEALVFGTHRGMEIDHSPAPLKSQRPKSYVVNFGIKYGQ